MLIYIILIIILLYCFYTNPGGGSGSSYAIFMVCFLNDHYVLGACISAYTHKKYINVPIIILCDDYIYNKWSKLLIKYFDRVIKIDMIRFKYVNERKKKLKKRYEWLEFSLNKWQTLKYDEYDKILFLDVSILPCDKKFYNLFNINTPGLLFINNDSNENGKQHNYTPPGSYIDYIKNISNYDNISGAIVLLKPNINDYNKFIVMVNDIFKKYMYAGKKTGPDETSLCYFYESNKTKLYEISEINCVIPWNNSKYLETASAYCYSSYYKPWIKPKNLCWEEELVWHEIIAIMNDPGVNELYEITSKKTEKMYESLPPGDQIKYFGKLENFNMDNIVVRKIMNIYNKK